MPSNRRLVSRVMRATQRTSSSSGSGRRKRTRELHGDAPGVGLEQQDGAADGLVEDRRAHAAVQPAGVALVLLARAEDAEELAAAGGGALSPSPAAPSVRRQLVEAGVEAERVVAAADQAHAADVLGAVDPALCPRRDDSSGGGSETPPSYVTVRRPAGA